MALVVVAACKHDAPTPAVEPPLPPQTIRCAVVGGMTETGFWAELTERFEQRTGHKVEVVATGPKPVVVDAFRKGDVDLLTVHASDGIINVVADGLAVDPQPWLRNDLVIVGPATDPARIKGEPDAAAALGKIVASGSKIVVHASMGADGVLHDLQESAKLVIPDAQLVVFSGERPQEVVAKAEALGAYTLVGRIPFVNGKIQHGTSEIMVRGDPRLRRPYLVVIAARAASDPRIRAARDFVAYLREPATQAWIAEFGKGRYDADPIFFPVTIAQGRQ